MNTYKVIKEQIRSNPILIYMKGTPEHPNCGFSAQAINILKTCNIRFAFVDVLQHPSIRLELPKYSNWPTFPQLWVSGELIGGCNIIQELSSSGELKRILEKTFSEQQSE
ncbi:Grx4 family monothiol glutaredoxin [Buchnera aphidicola (Thelaxes californica)]|uniref:Glutaredoxin n=1 Tax=Buchnera aphidicola (Thelaxes californica) TaxID=1315998 RepID=A0A4D6YA89_9GAMM|nr:Grx4 family monothiol glutaredoxin [Buchnera aphidicola]QCI26697.1 Grx4 family monothiol glutaredoxin [Buchnera aphidicola (Thelaxes californica)]